MRPGMYIGKLGDGSSTDDGIYILVKEVVDNCIDEFVMGAGKTIEIKIGKSLVSVRDYDPETFELEKERIFFSKMNTGGHVRAFEKICRIERCIVDKSSKRRRALSGRSSIRSGQIKTAEFSNRELLSENLEESTGCGTSVSFVPDVNIFGLDNSSSTVQMLKNYVYLNRVEPSFSTVKNMSSKKWIERLIGRQQQY